MSLTTLGTSSLLILYSLKHFLNILKDIFKEIRYVYNKIDFLVLINNLWQNTHNMKFSISVIFKCIVVWHLGTFMLLRSHYQHSPPEFFSLCKTEPLCPLNHNYSLLFLTLGNSHSPYVSMNLTTLGTSYKWNHANLSFSDWLISFECLWGSSVLYRGSIRIPFFLTHNNPLYVYVPHFVYPLSVNGHLGCFHFLTTVNAAVNMGVQIFVCIFAFDSFG